MKSSPALVLMYHRVGSVVPDPHRLQVAPERFRDQLETLARSFEIVPLAQIAASGTRPRAAVTLDDGYVDNLEVAKPILDALGVPATVFVTTGLVDDRAGFWQDRLADLMLRGPVACTHLELELGRPFVLHTGSSAGRERAYRFVHARLRRRRPTEINAVLAAIALQVGREPSVARASLPLTADGVRALVRGGGVTVGAHTVNHAMLAGLDEREQRLEIAESRSELEALSGAVVDAFAYPFGSAGDFDEVSVGIARETFSLAVTAEPGLVPPDGDPFLVPRFAAGDWSADELGSRLRRWAGGRAG